MRRVALVLVLTLAAAPAWGQREDAASVAARAEARARERDALRLDARAAAAEVERLRARLIVLARSQAADEGAALAQRARFAALTAQEQALTARMKRERGRQGRLLGALQSFSRRPPPALLVSPRAANDAVRAAILMKAVTPELRRRAAALQGQLDAVARVRRQAALAGSALFLTESELADQRAETERLLAEKSALQRRLNSGAEAAAREAVALARRAESLGGLVGDLSNRTAAPAIAPPRPLAAPVKGEMVRRYGQPTGAGRSSGMAWRAGPSAQVLSPAAGSVEYAGPLKGWGGVVIIRLDGGYRVVLAGLDRVINLTGRRVAPGEPLGRLTASRDGPHELYMEVRREGAPVDPSAWLDAGP